MAEYEITGTEIGRLGPEGCPLVVGVDGDRVTIGAPIGGWALSHTDRDRFMRLWCEAERQAEGDAATPPSTAWGAPGSPEGCGAVDGMYECTETRPHRIHIARAGDPVRGKIVHAWDVGHG